MSQHFEHEHDQEQEEALSLCDLPTMSNVENGEKEIKNNEINDDEFDFNFGLLIKSSDTLEPEMCSADDVISGGQLLPFRHSVSSETGLLKTRTASWRSVSRSESMDRIGLCSRSGSGSSRSSSIRSQSTDTSSNNSIKTFPVSKSRNNFQSHPSSKPKVWATNYPTTSPISKKSTMWDVLSLGLVRGPGIELHDLKQRHRISTSSKNTTPFIILRSKSSTSNRSNNNDGKISDLLMKLNKKTNNNKGGFFKSCKCSVLAIEPIPPREFGRNSRYFGTKLSTGPKYSTSSLGNYNYHVLKEDKELAQKNLSVDEERKEKLKNKKKVMSHQYRTFEWLRDLSHANFLNN